MIRSMRKHMKIILWFLIATFVIWGGSVSVLSKKEKYKTKSDYAGKMFGKKISFEKFEEMLKEVELEAYLNGTENSSQEKEKFYDQAWQRLMLIEEANRKKIKISDKDIATAIFNIPAFNSGGKFQEQDYLYFVTEKLRIKPKTFETFLGNNIRISMLRENIFNKINAPSDEEIKTEFIRENEKAKISYIHFESKNFLKSVNASEQDVLNYFNQSKNEFKKEEQANVEYIYIPVEPEKFTKDISQAMIENYYNTNKNEFAKTDEKGEKIIPELGTIKEQVLNKISAKMAYQEAKDLSLKAYNILKVDPDFAKVARELNITTGQTGFFSKTDVIPQIGFAPYLGRTIFKLSKNEIAYPVDLETGFCIVKLIEKIPAHIPAFESIKEQVREKLLEKKSVEAATSIAQTTLEKINQITQSKSFEEAAAELGLNVKKTDYFSRAGYISGIGYSKDVIDVSFSTPVSTIAKSPASTTEGCVIIKVEELIPVSNDTLEKEFPKFKENYLAGIKLKQIFSWIGDLEKQADLQRNI